MHTKKLLAVITPIVSFSLTSAAFAGNEPASPAQIPNAAVTRPQTTPDTTGQRGTTGGIMNRPEMAPFKRIQMYAWKFRQKLSNLQAILDQARRTNAISSSEAKKLQNELDRLCEVEPSLARGGWKDVDIEAFDKDIAKYQAKFEKASKVYMPAQIAAPAGQAAAKDAAAATSKDAAAGTKTASPKK